MERLFPVTQESTIKKKKSSIMLLKKKVLYHDIRILQIISGFVCLFYFILFSFSLQRTYSLLEVAEVKNFNAVRDI